MAKWGSKVMYYSIFGIFISSVISSLWAENKDYSVYYKVMPGSREWNSCKNSFELIEKLNLNEDLITSLSTGKLLEVSLQYPFLNRIGNFNNVDIGFKNIINNFNGLREFLKRKDAAQVLSSYYLDCKDDVKSVAYIELLLSQFEIISMLDQEQLFKILSQVTMLSNVNSITNNFLAIRILGALNNSTVKNLQRNNRFLKRLYSGTLLKDEKVKIGDAIKEALDESNYKMNLNDNFKKCRLARGDTTVLTPNKSEVTATVHYSEPTSQENLDSYTQYNKQNFPELIQLASATGKYNCHSFGWYINDTTNNCWINNPDNFWLDESYVEVDELTSNCRIVYFGPKLVEKDTFMIIEFLDEKDTIPYTITVEDTTDYSNPLHSAVYKPDGFVDIIPEDHPVVSKWGQSPLYAHALKYVDPSYDTTHMRYYVLNSETDNKNTMIKSNNFNSKIKIEANLMTIYLNDVFSNSNLSFYTVNGKEIKVLSLNEKKNNIDLSSFSRGVYLAKLKTKGTIETTPIVIK